MTDMDIDTVLSRIRVGMRGFEAGEYTTDESETDGGGGDEF